MSMSHYTPNHRPICFLPLVYVCVSLFGCVCVCVCSAPHPISHILHYPKGKRLIPRVVGRLPDAKQLARTILSRLESLDALHVPLGSSNALGESCGLPGFMEHVLPAALVDVVGGVGLADVCSMTRAVYERHPVDWVVKSRVGVCVLTLLLSRAEICKSEGGEPTAAVAEWYVCRRVCVANLRV